MENPQRLRALCLVLVSLGVLAGVYAAARQPDVIYVPTPHEVVAEMLRLSGVTKDDVIYDLGCGDGRLVITAARNYGARGVGVDIDPQRISESRANAQQDGVSERVQFLQQDLFETDIREATVVTLYLLPRLNVQLRPVLLRDLRPGTRVVSHDYDMAEWKPDQTVSVKGPSRTHPVYYWVIPAKVEGVWRVKMPTPNGDRQYLLRLRQQFQEVHGTLRAEGQEVTLANATLTGDRLRFTLATDAQEKMSFEGQVTDEAMRGSVEVHNGGHSSRHDWAAQREAANANGDVPR